MRILRGVVYIMKSKGPRTEPQGTPYSELCKEEKQSLHFTQKVRDERYIKPVENRAVNAKPRQRQESFCEPIAVMRWSWMYKRDVSVEWCRR